MEFINKYPALTPSGMFSSIIILNVFYFLIFLTKQINLKKKKIILIIYDSI